MLSFTKRRDPCLASVRRAGTVLAVLAGVGCFACDSDGRARGELDGSAAVPDAALRDAAAADAGVSLDGAPFDADLGDAGRLDAAASDAAHAESGC